MNCGPITASATVNCSAGYMVTGVTNQDRVGAFAPANLFFRYDLNDKTQFTLNIDNVLDDYPPFINQNSGIANGTTLGRYIQVGIQTRF